MRSGRVKKNIERIVVPQIEKEEPDISDMINEKYKEVEELLDEDEAEE